MEWPGGRIVTVEVFADASVYGTEGLGRALMLAFACAYNGEAAAA